MKSELVDQARELIPEVPLLINMVSRRVSQLAVGRTPLVSGPETIGLGHADIALLEIIEGKVALVEEDEDEDGTAKKKTAKKKTAK